MHSSTIRCVYTVPWNLMSCKEMPHLSIVLCINCERFFCKSSSCHAWSWWFPAVYGCAGITWSFPFFIYPVSVYREIQWGCMDSWNSHLVRFENRTLYTAAGFSATELLKHVFLLLREEFVWLVYVSVSSEGTSCTYDDLTVWVYVSDSLKETSFTYDDLIVWVYMGVSLKETSDMVISGPYAFIFL